jgi:hypothetical protein
MSATTRTKVYLDADDYRQLKLHRAPQKRAPAAVLREAVAEYTVRHAPKKFPRSVGAFRSGRLVEGRVEHVESDCTSS